MKLTNTKYYVDDGYTGTNFNRPGFQAMLEDIETGYVTTVMVKDLSRLGRDYVSVGHYTDNFFPEQIVMLELRSLASFLIEDEEAFADILEAKTNKSILNQQDCYSLPLYRSD